MQPRVKRLLQQTMQQQNFCPPLQIELFGDLGGGSPDTYFRQNCQKLRENIWCADLGIAKIVGNFAKN